jgi:nicotinamide mononucleotide transporter
MVQDWVIKNYIELLGLITSVLFTVLSIRQKPSAWLFGILSAIFYAIVFYHTKLYASTALQGYYFAISIYGWYYWLKSSNSKDSGNDLLIQKISLKTTSIVLICALPTNIVLWWILSFFNDSYPVLDSFTTMISIVATWMLARKYLENWILWIVNDTISIGLYVYIQLYPTAILFVIYTVLAIIGYIKWTKDYKIKKS